MRVLAWVVFVVLAASSAWAEQWQIRSFCDLRKGAGSQARAGDCANLAAETLMLLPDKAGPGNVAVVADFTDNMEKAGVSFETPCRDQAHCPESAYTLRYAFVSKKILQIPQDKVFTALVCRENFSDTPPDDGTCRTKLVKVILETVKRARQEGSLLAVLKCGGAESDAIRPDGKGVSGYELRYAFVQLPDLLPMADGSNPKAAATFAAGQLAQPSGQDDQPGLARPASAPAARPVVTPAVAGSGQTLPPAASSAPPASQAAAAPAAPANPDPVLAKGEFIMQVASLPNLAQAETLADRLQAKGIEASFEEAQVNGREVYRVTARGDGNPDSFKQKLAEMGCPGAILKH